MDLYLKDKIVFVSASASGIGKSIAEVFLGEGAIVIINDISEEKIEETTEEFEKKFASSRIGFFHGDITKNEEISRLKDYIYKTYGRLDILVPNLGSGKPMTNNEFETDEIQRFLDINLFSALKLVNGLSDLIANSENGSIVFISSIVGIEKIPAPTGYAIAKSGLLTLTKNLSVKLAEKKIRVNAVAPGNVYFKGGRWEELLQNNPDIENEYIKKEVPLKRFASPEEIAYSVVFLASQISSFTTGNILVVDGGQSRSYR